MLNYNDWKPVASRLWPTGDEEKLKAFYIDATGVRGIKSTDENGVETERLGTMNFEHYQKAMKEVRASKVLEDKLKDPDFRKFYDADVGKKNELITF